MIMEKNQTREERIKALDYDYAAQPKERLTCCNVCGEASLYTLTHHDRYGYPASVDGCPKCGMVFLNPRMTPDAYTDFYIHTYRPLVSAYHGRQIDAKTVQADQHGYTDKLVEMLRPYLGSGKYKSLLDVGGSTGIVAAGLTKAYGLEATIIDPAPDEIEEAQQLGIETVTAFVEDWDPQGKQYDLIGVFQTIDHLLDLKGTFTKLREVVAADGLLIVDIVDFRHAYLRSWSVNEGTKIDHPYYLTEMSTEGLLARTGFKPLRKWVSPDQLHIFYVCQPVPTDPHALPKASEVSEFFKEIRYVQGTSWQKNS